MKRLTFDPSFTHFHKLPSPVICHELRLILTEMIWSPRRNSPERSAGPPAKMKDTKIPSPSSPPTILKPNPVDPFFKIILRGSLEKNEEKKKSIKFIIHDLQTFFLSTSRNTEFHYNDSQNITR